MARQKKQATCHPGERNHGHGLCRKCYWEDYEARNSETLAEYRRVYHSKNKEKRNATTRQWIIDNPDRQAVNQQRAYTKLRARDLKKKYGLTEDDYEKMLQEQGGTCAVCKRKRHHYRLCIDHNHITNQVRGLLCGPCNASLGFMEENVEFLLSSIEYLQKHTQEKI